MAVFSSRGPTQEKTVKPDVVAPGSRRLLERLLGRAVPGALHRVRLGLRDEHGDSARRGRRRAPAPAPPVLDAGDGQVGADDDGDRGGLPQQPRGHSGPACSTAARGGSTWRRRASPGSSFDKPSLSGGEKSAGRSRRRSPSARRASSAAPTRGTSPRRWRRLPGSSTLQSTPTLALGAGDTRAIPGDPRNGDGSRNGRLRGLDRPRQPGDREEAAHPGLAPRDSAEERRRSRHRRRRAKATGVAGDVRPAYTAMLDSLGLDVHRSGSRPTRLMTCTSTAQP